MDETPQLKLPLLQPSQAQKHVTVNEALVRVDALVQLVLTSRQMTTPPAVVLEGAAYALPIGAVNEWSGHDGEVAIGSNGGWAFVTPRAGWHAWMMAEGYPAVHDGTTWNVGMATLSTSGAGTRIGLKEIDHIIGAGTTSSTLVVIPSHAMVLGVTARVTQAITGTLASWQLGTAGAPDRFGSGLGISADSWAKGMLSVPQTYYAPTSLLLTASAGAFSAGRVRLAVHFFELTLPAA